VDTKNAALLAVPPVRMPVVWPPLVPTVRMPVVWPLLVPTVLPLERRGPVRPPE
jgi:hypothetical protein